MATTRAFCGASDRAIPEPVRGGSPDPPRHRREHGARVPGPCAADREPRRAPAERATPTRVAGALAGALLGVLAISGCTQVATEPKAGRAWPPPPQPARIVLQQVVLGAKDFEKPDFFSALGRLIVGDQRQTFLRPQAVALDGDRRLYIADQEHQAIHVFDLKEGKARFWDRVERTLFVSPAGVAVLDGGNVAVSDSMLNRVFVLTPDGKLVRQIDRPGGFRRPTGMAYDAGRRLFYVVDTLAHDVCVFRLTGEYLRCFGAPGTGDGLLNFPTYIAVDGQGLIYVTDSLNFRVQIFNAEEKYVRQIGKLGDATGFMAVPKGVAVDSHGHLYVADSALSTVQVFDRDGTLLLAFGERGDGPGSFQIPTGLAIGPGDRIYVCDAFARRLQVFQYVEPNDETTKNP